MRLWDLASGVALRVYQGHEAGLWSVLAATGPAGPVAYTAANDGTLRRWPLGLPGQWVWQLPGREPAAALVLPEQRLLLLGLADGAIEALPLPEPAAAPEPTPSDPDARPRPAPDPDQATLAAAPSDPRAAPPPLFRLDEAHDAMVLRFAISPTDATIATAGHDHTARLWRLAPGDDGPLLTPLHRLDQHSDSVHAVAFSADGRTLATAGYDGQVGLFDVATGDGALTRVAEHGRIASAAFTPDGTALLSAHYEERQLQLWQRNGLALTDPRTIARLSDWPLWAALSPDGRQVAAVGRELVVSVYPLPAAATPTAPAGTDPRPGADPTPLRLIGHEQTVFRALFLPDGRQLATASADMTLRLWDLGAAPPGADPAAPAPASADAAPSPAAGQPLFTLPLPTTFKGPSPLWDADLRCTAAHCWIAVPLTIGRVALYRLPYADPPPTLGQPQPQPPSP